MCRWFVQVKNLGPGELPILNSALRPPWNKKFKLLHKDQARKIKKGSKVLPLAWRVKIEGRVGGPQLKVPSKYQPKQNIGVNTYQHHFEVNLI